MFDMSQCKKGDKLVCRNGTVAEFIVECSKFHPHYKYEVALKILKRDVVITTTSEGCRFFGEEDQYDIVGFYKEEPKMIERDKEYDLKVTGEQLAILLLLTGGTNSYRSKCKLYDKLDSLFPVNRKNLNPSWIDSLNANRYAIDQWIDSLFTKPETEEERNKRELLEEYEAVKKHFEELGKKLGVE